MVPAAVVDESPVVVNAGGSGVFRSRYGRAELAALSPHIDQLEELERATLVADSWAALFAGQVTWQDFLTTARGLGNQNEFNTWGSVASAVGLAHRALDGAQHDTLVAQVRELFGPQFERLGWDAREGEGELTPQLRAILISTLGVIGQDTDIQAEAVRRFETDDLDGNLARAILRVVAQQDRPGDYQTFLERYRHAITPQEEHRYLYSLGEFSDLAVASDAAERCFSDFRNQDAPLLLGYLSTNLVTGPAIWNIIADRWDEALSAFPPSVHVRMTLGLATFIRDADFADTVEAFHASHPLGGEQRTVEQNIERMRVGLAFTAALREQF